MTSPCERPSTNEFALGGRPVAVISHERSGTHFCIDSLRASFRETYKRQWPFQTTHKLYWDLQEYTRRPLAEIRRGLARARGRPLLKLHYQSDLSDVPHSSFANFYRSLLAESDRVYVVRDGRDVIVSYFHFRIQFDRGTTDFHEYLRAPLRPGGSTPARYWADHVAGWTADPNVRIVRFENLRSDHAATVATLGRHLGLTTNSRPIQPIRADRSRLLRTIKRALGIQRSTAILPGAGVSGGWRARFSQQDKDRFRKEAGQTLVQLGYELSDDW